MGKIRGTKGATMGSATKRQGILLQCSDNNRMRDEVNKIRLMDRLRAIAGREGVMDALCAELEVAEKRGDLKKQAELMRKYLQTQKVEPK